MQEAQDGSGTAGEAIGRPVPGDDDAEQTPQPEAADPDGGNPWRITTFDEENWPPQFELEQRQLAFAALGILPTVGLTANQRAIANGTSVVEEVGPSFATVPRSGASDVALGGLPVEVFEGETQNALARSVVSGGVIAGMDEVGRFGSRNLPDIQQRNNEFWANRNNTSGQRITVPRGQPPQLNSGLARPTVFSIAPTVTALNLAADELTDRLDIDPEPTDENNNRYYWELATDALATGAGVFGPIFGENYLNQRSAAVRAGTPAPRVGNVAAQTALAFALPVAQTAAAGILTEEPPDTSDPIYRGSRAAIQYVADDVAEVGDTLFGEAQEEDGNDANATRAVGNAAAAVATPVLDAVGGIVPNALDGARDSWRYLRTGERQEPAPVVSDEALASAEESRARVERAWELAREGEPTSNVDAAVQAGANLLYGVGRGTVGALHSLARVADPFQSEESRFLAEPTQGERAQESFRRAGQAWQQAGDAINYLRGRSPAPEDSTDRGDNLVLFDEGPDDDTIRVTVTGRSPDDESIRRSGFPICSDDGEIECIEPGSLDLDDSASVGSVRRGSGGVRSENPETGRVTEFPLCSTGGQVDCVDPDTIDPGNPNSVGSVVRGDGGAAFTDPTGRRVQYDDCSVFGEVDCLVPGTNQLRVGGGRPTRTDAEGRQVEVITYESLQSQYESMTPQDYQRALQRYDDQQFTMPDGTRIPNDGDGRPSPALTNPVSVGNVLGTIDAGREYVGDQLERLPVVGRFVDRWRGDGDDPDRGVVNGGGR